MRRYRPLRGVRVLSFEAAFSLPAGTRVLSELGAEVVRVGRPKGDFPPYTHRTDASAVNKRSVAIDLGNDEGRTLAFRLAARADVVCNNFRPRFFRRLGLSYEALCAVRPDIIVLQLSGYGTPGPWQDIGAFGPSVEAAGGMDASIGDPEDPPAKVGSGVFADGAAGRYTALALTMALERRRTTGVGRYIDLSMYEGIAHLLGDRVLEAARTDRVPAKRGNRSALCAPQGIYPCRGDDEWLALSVCNDDQWRSLCRALAGSGDADSALLDELATASAAERARAHDRIDRVIAEWTRGRAKEDAAALLQGCGVPAGPVQKVSDLPFDPQLRFRGAFQLLRHAEPVLGFRAHPQQTLSWRVEGYARPSIKDAHPDGADNRAVLRSWLGLSKPEIARLYESGALLPPSQSPVPEGNRVVGAPVDADFAARLGLEPAAEPVS